MPNYHRFYEGGGYFFTVVTFNRLPILTSDAARRILHSAWLDVSQRMPFETVAVCLLPEHMHCVWTLPENDQNFSVRWREIKRLFTKGYLDEIGPGESRNSSRQKRGEAAIWQRRFWEHIIRDQDDLNRHIDYNHFKVHWSLASVVRSLKLVKPPGHCRPESGRGSKVRVDEKKNLASPLPVDTITSCRF